MVLPAGCEGPLHLHTDAEEVFFVLRGNKLRFIIEHQGERFETVLKERDLFSVPPGVYRGLVNERDEEAPHRRRFASMAQICLAPWMSSLSPFPETGTYLPAGNVHRVLPDRQCQAVIRWPKLPA